MGVEKGIGKKEKRYQHVLTSICMCDLQLMRTTFALCCTPSCIAVRAGVQNHTHPDQSTQ
jgi:hypothetical protein